MPCNSPEYQPPANYHRQYTDLSRDVQEKNLHLEDMNRKKDAFLCCVLKFLMKKNYG